MVEIRRLNFEDYLRIRCTFVVAVGTGLTAAWGSGRLPPWLVGPRSCNSCGGLLKIFFKIESFWGNFKFIIKSDHFFDKNNFSLIWWNWVFWLKNVEIDNFDSKIFKLTFLTRKPLNWNFWTQIFRKWQFWLENLQTDKYGSKIFKLTISTQKSPKSQLWLRNLKTNDCIYPFWTI